VKRVLELKQCSSSCPLETTRVNAHAVIPATCGGVPLFGVKNRAPHLSVSRTTLEKIVENWSIGTGKRGWRGRTALGNDDGGVFCINLICAEGVADRKKCHFRCWRSIKIIEWGSLTISNTYLVSSFPSGSQPTAFNYPEHARSPVADEHPIVSG